MAEEKKSHRRIEIAMEDGEYDEARDLAQRAVKDDPSDGLSWYYLLLAKHQVREPEAFLDSSKDWRREEAYRQAVAHGGNAGKLQELGRQWAYQQAVALRQQHRFEAALAYFEETGDYLDSSRQATECRMRVEEAQAKERRLAEELAAQERAEQERYRQRAEAAEKARKARTQGTGKKAAENQAAQANETRESISVRKAASGQTSSGQVLETVCIEMAEKLCRKPYCTSDEVKEIIKIADDCRALFLAAKWGEHLEDPRAYEELAEISPFWQVYGAEEKEGVLAARLYDAEQGARAGLPWDETMACYWAGVAASQEDKKGFLQLGRYYECGVGVNPNFKLAGYFYQKAESRTDVCYFRDLFRANKEYCGSAQVVDELENISNLPKFEMNDAALRAGSYWKLHIRTETAKVRLKRRMAAQLEELLRPLQGEFEEMARIDAYVDRKEEAIALKALLFAVLLGIPWTIFVLFMPRFVGIYGNLWRIPGVITLIFAYIIFYVIFHGLFELPQKRRMSRKSRRWRELFQKVQKLYEQARMETHQDSWEEFREYTRWESRSWEMQRAMGIKTPGWRHAYLMYYGAGVCGAKNLDAADQYALNAAKGGSAAKLPYVPAPIMQWLLKKLSAEENPQDLLKIAVQYGRDSRNRFNAVHSWKPVFALECILLHAKFWLNLEPENDNGFWRTNPKLLEELAGYYCGFGAKVAPKDQNPAVSLILADFAAEVYKDQYRAGKKAVLADLAKLYSVMDIDPDEESRWARLAFKERCPEFAEYAFHYCSERSYVDIPLFTMEELKTYANDIKADSNISTKNRSHVQKLLEDIRLQEEARRKEAERQQERREMIRSYRERVQREAIEQELDRRERNLNIFLGDGYRTNQEVYLSGGQSLSDYVNNEMYRDFRRSELEKKAREREM